MATMPGTSQEPGSSTTQRQAAPKQTFESSDRLMEGGIKATRKNSRRRHRRSAQRAALSDTLGEPGSSAYQRLGARSKNAPRQLPQKPKKTQNNLAVDQYLVRNPISRNSASDAAKRHVIPDSETNGAHSSPGPVVSGAKVPPSRLVSDAERSNVAGAPDIKRRIVVPDTLPARRKPSKDGLKSICNICHVPCSSKKNLKEHMRGRRHRLHVFLSAVDSLRDQFKLDKFGIKIRVVLKDGLPRELTDVVETVDVNSLHVMKFILSNEGQKNVCLKRCDLLKSDGFKLTFAPTLILPGADYTVNLKCSKKHVGCFSTVVVFMLINQADQHVDHVTRYVTIHVEDPSLDDLRAKVPYKKPPRVSVEKAVTEIIEGAPLESLVTGEDKLEKDVRLSKYEIPTHLRKAVNHGLDLKTCENSDPLLKLQIQEIRRNLECQLNARSHKVRFSTMLFIEESQMAVDIRKYDLCNVALLKCQENKRLLSLEVPGLLENRPSVLRGDHLFVRALQADGKAESCEYKGYVHEVHEKHVWLGFNERLMKKWLPNMKFNCRFTFNRLPQQLQHRAIQLAREHSLEAFLFPTADTVSLHGIPTSLTRQRSFFNRDVENNAEQNLAVNQIVCGTSRPAPFLVFGPPGTGKTVTIVEAICQVIKYHPSAHILACAPSNSAADLIASRVLKYMQIKSKLYRMCAASREWRTVPEDLKRYCNRDKQNSGYVFPSKTELIEKTIIICTLVTAGRLVTANFPSKHFTHIFIDEAGQATEPETLIPLAGIFESEHGGQVVLAGDPKQLGPVIRSPVAIGCGLGMSLLERYMQNVLVYMRNPETSAYDDKVLVKLVRNYRSHPDILQIPNELFYDNELEPHANKIARESLCQWEDLPKKGFPIIFHGVVGKDEREERSPSFFNVDEISVVKGYVDKLLRSSAKIKVKQNEIGIISPYRKQVQKIKRLMERSNYTDVTVGSVEEFQGQERRVIIISTVRSNTAHLPLDYLCKLGFLKNPKRFNVAVTRAKALLIVVGNPHVLVKDENWSKLLRLCISRDAYIGCTFDVTSLDREDDVELLLGKMENLNLDSDTLHIEPGLIGGVTQQNDPAWASNE